MNLYPSVGTVQPGEVRVMVPSLFFLLYDIRLVVKENIL